MRAYSSRSVCAAYCWCCLACLIQNWLHKKLRFNENDQRVRMTTIQTTTVVRAAALTKKPLSTMPRTPLRVLGAVNSRHTTPPPRDEIPSSSNVFLTNARGKPRRFNTGRKKVSKKMALEEGSDDVVLLDATSSSVDEFILSPPDSEIITEDINELQK